MSATLRDYLVANKFLTLEEFDLAMDFSKKEDVNLMTALEDSDTMNEKDVLDAFSKFYRTPKANLNEMDIPASIIDQIPLELAIKHKIIPIDRAGNNIIIAMSNPRDLGAIEAVRFSTGFFTKPVISTERRITEALKKYYSNTSKRSSSAGAQSQKKPKATAKKTAYDASLDKLVKQAQNSGNQVEAKLLNRSDIAGNNNEGPIIKLVNQILIQCMKRGASDIHIEPYETFMRVRLRIDGTLIEIARPPIAIRPPLISRIKIISDIDITETRLPQDGAINVEIGGKPVDFRVNTLPTVYGEKVVLRILDQSSLQVDMTQLGFDQDELDKFKKSIHTPFGMVLVTGPTGSGKTTTLYSALQDLNNDTENVMTAEDPVEFNLEGINQVRVRPDIGLGFAEALRAFLRQDPDVIMVGEIRDFETAAIAIKAALTGHMVLSTLHTNSAADTIARLINMGIEPFNLVSALTCITAQRLLRKICDECKVVDDSISPELLVSLGIHPQYATRVKAYKGEGCRTCAGTGAKGRVAVHEVLKLNDPIREAMVQNLPAMAIKKVAMSTGMRTLRQSALNKMAQGLVTPLEVAKATIEDSDNSDKKPSAA